MSISIFDVLQTFDYKLKYNNDHYIVFQNQSENHLVYIHVNQGQFRFIDNNLCSGDAEKLFQHISPNLDLKLKESRFDTLTLKSLETEKLAARILSMKQSDEAIPGNLKEIYMSDNGYYKIPLKNGKRITNTYTISQSENLNKKGGYYHHDLNETKNFLRIYTDNTFFQEYASEQYDDDFLFISNINDKRIFPNLDTIIKSYKEVILIPDSNYENTFSTYVKLLSIYQSDYIFLITDSFLTIKSNDKKELKKFCNHIQKEYKRLQNALLDNKQKAFDPTLYDFYYYSSNAFSEIPKSTQLLQFLIQQIQLKLEIPFHVAATDFTEYGSAKFISDSLVTQPDHQATIDLDMSDEIPEMDHFDMDQELEFDPDESFTESFDFENQPKDE